MTHVSRNALAFEWAHEQPSAAHAYLLPAVLAALRRGAPARVLDLGCGNGVFTARIVENGFTVVGLDASASGIAIAQRLLPGAELLQWSLEDPLPPSLHQRFDAVIAVEVIEHLPTPRVLCARATEALRPGGQFVLTTPYHGYLKNLALALTGQLDQHWQPGRDGGHIKFFSPRTLTALLESEGFAVTDLARVGRIPPLAKSMVLECRQR
jgi:2-polyprenyl-3-methyl-5-hydroxy-6-metoxy-1,4-benzoquinol methylase